MFTTKYCPKRIEDFIGNKAVIMPFIRWLLEWESANKKSKCALVSGLNGIGKSLLVELILHKHDYNIINLSIDDERNKDYITKIIKPLLKTKKNFMDQENCLVVSDIDCGGDYGFMASLLECIKFSEIPIICICDDRYNQNIKSILPYCLDIKLVKPKFDEVYPLIYKVATTENIKISKKGVDKLYEESNGDIRFILNTLQLGLRKCETTKNIQSSNIFEIAGKLLSLETNLEEKIRYYWMADDINTLMIHENYINNTLTTRDEVKRLNNIAYAADAMGDVDMLSSEFNFDLEPYVALNTIRASSKCTKKAQIKFPQFLGKISTINKNKREKMNFETVKFLKDNEISDKVSVKKPKAKKSK
jgi:replication factor C subunit 1